MTLSQSLFQSGVVLLVLFAGAVFVNTLITILLSLLAIDWKAGRTSTGQLQIKPEGFVIKYIFRANIIEPERDKDTPWDSCELFFGIFWHWWKATMFAVLLGILDVAWFFYAILMAFIGRLPKRHRPISFFPSKFNSYQRCGKNGQTKFVAPWKCAVPVLILLGIIYFQEISFFVKSNPGLILYSGSGLAFVAIILFTGRHLINSYRKLKPILSAYTSKIRNLIHILRDHHCAKFAPPSEVQDGQSTAIA